MDVNATLFGQMITFAIFVWFSMKFVWPMITKVMKDRQENIANGLADAEKGRRDLERAKIEHREIVEDAKLQSSHIVQAANKRAHQIIEEALEKSRKEGQRIIDNAQAELDQALNRARRELQSEVASLAVVGAEKILKQEIDSAKHQGMIDRFLEELNHVH